MERVRLNNGVEMPIVGLGTFKATGSQVYSAVSAALKKGYRLIDTAEVYRTEGEVGRAIRDSGIPREEIFISTKLWNPHQGYEGTKIAFSESLKKLGVDYIDLYLIHWYKGPEKMRESWKAMEELYREGKIRALGVSNFSMYHIIRLLEKAEIAPAINQIEVHVGLPQYNMQEFCERRRIKVMAYAPIQKGRVFESVELKRIGEVHGKTPGQVALRFLIERGIVVIPKSVHEERIGENIDIFDFDLSPEDLEIIGDLCDGIKIYPDSDNCYF